MSLFVQPGTEKVPRKAHVFVQQQLDGFAFFHPLELFEKDHQVVVAFVMAYAVVLRPSLQGVLRVALPWRTRSQSWLIYLKGMMLAACYCFKLPETLR